MITTHKGNYNDFKEALGQRESEGNYKVVNSFGFLGKYQFGKPRLYDCGLSIDGWHPRSTNITKKKFVSKSDFLNDPKLQEDTFLKHVTLWLKTIRRKYSQYIGQVIAGITITESGLVAGLHLKGEGSAKYPGLRQFLESGQNNIDGYGTGITEYISKFGGYDLREVV